MSRSPKFSSRRPWRALGAALATVVVLAACGGSSQIDPFQPRRIVAFGDEASVIDSDGRKFTVNQLDAEGDLDCSLNPNWVQLVSESFGHRFPNCNPNGVAAPSLAYAAADAKVADVLAQIAAHQAGDVFTSKDLATIYVGEHDLRELYARYPVETADALVAEAERRGAQLSTAVNTVSQAGGRVLIVTMPNLALTPWGRAQAGTPGSDRAVLLTRLSERFNARMRVGLANDSGRSIGLVDLSDIVQLRVDNPSALGFANVVDAACDLSELPAGTALTACDTSRLKKNSDGTALATDDSWLWAGETQMAPPGHRALGNAAANRARNNPF